MKRGGKELTKLASGDRRRLADFRNAWRKMSAAQRGEALAWMSNGTEKISKADGSGDGGRELAARILIALGGAV